MLRVKICLIAAFCSWLVFVYSLINWLTIQRVFLQIIISLKNVHLQCVSSYQRKFQSNQISIMQHSSYLTDYMHHFGDNEGPQCSTSYTSLLSLEHNLSCCDMLFSQMHIKHLIKHFGKFALLLRWDDRYHSHNALSVELEPRSRKQEAGEQRL